MAPKQVTGKAFAPAGKPKKGKPSPKKDANLRSKKSSQERNLQTSFISQLAELVTDTVMIVELASRKIRYGNNLSLLLNDYAPEEVSKMTIDERNQLIHPDDLSALNTFYGSFTASTTNEEVHTSKCRAKNKVGEWKTFLMRGKIFDRNQDVSIHSILIVYENITEKKKADEQHQQFLIKLSDSLRAEPDADALANRAIQMLAEHLLLDRCYVGITLLDDNLGVFPYQFGNERVRPLPSEGVRLSDFPDALRTTFDETLVIKDFQNTEGLTETEKQNFAALGFGALVVANVRKEVRKPEWSINAVSATPRRWTPLEIQLIEEVTERTWAAVERAKAEKRLRQSEEKYRWLFDTMDHGFAIVEPIYNDNGKLMDYRYLELNPAFVKLTGIKESFVGKTVLDIIPDLDPFWIRTYQKLIDTRQSVRFEYFVPQLSRWFDISAFYYGTGLIGIYYEDITERKQHEQLQVYLLKLSDALRPLSNASEIEDTACRLLGEYLEVNRVYFPVLNEEKGFAIVERQYLRTGASSMAGTYPLAAFSWSIRILKTNQAVIVDNIYDSEIVPGNDVAAMGAIQLISVVAVPLLKNGQLTGALTVSENRFRKWKPQEIEVTRETQERMWAAAERARAEQALKESEEKFRMVFEIIIEACCIFEMIYNDLGKPVDWKILEANAGYERQSGLKDVAGKLASEVMPGTEPYWIETFGRVAESGKAEQIEKWHQPTERWIHSSTARVGGPGSRRLVSVFYDITERKRHEEQQAFLNDISKDLLAFNNIEDEIQKLAEKIGKHFKAKWVSFAERSADNEYYFVSGWNSNDVVSIKGANLIRDYLTEEQTQLDNTGTPTIVNDTQTDARVNPVSYASINMHSYIIIPMAPEGLCRFRLCIFDDQARNWRNDEIELAKELTYRIWPTMERAKVEQALRKSEAKFRRLSDSGLVAVAFFDLQGAIIEANDAFLEMLGVTREELNSSKVRWDVYTAKEWMPRTLQAIEEFKQTGYISPFEKQFYHSNGELRWGIFAGATIEDGRIGVSLVVDITQRRKAEEALHKSEARLAKDLEDTKQLQQFSNLVIQLDDEDAIYETLLDTAMKLMRSDFASFQLYSPETESLSLIAHKNFHQDSAASWNTVSAGSGSVCGEALRNQTRILVNDIETGGFAKDELEIFHNSGIRAVQSTPIVSRNGDLIGMLNTQWKQPRNFSDEEFHLFDALVRQAADLIERKHTQEALRKSEERLQRAVNTARTVVWEWDVNENSIQTTDNFKDVYGLSVIQFAEQGYQLVAPTDRETHFSKVQKASTEGGGYYSQFRIIRPDTNEIVWLEERADAITDENGKVIKLVGASIDITDLKTAEEAVRKSEEQLKQFNIYLEQQVAERTAELKQSQKELQEKNKQLQHTLAQVESFNYIASHDLQEPLRKIQTFIELVNEFEISEPEMGKYLAGINASSARMSDLINSLLQYSRLSRVRDAFQSVDLNKVLDNVKIDYELGIQEKQAIIESDLLPTIRAIPFQMHQVFSNLISNSLKFCKTQPQINISSRIITGDEIRKEGELDVNKKYVQLIFSDNGIGFDNQYNKKIFEVFQRLHSKSAYSGTGIGLSIVDKIVKQHNGLVRADGHEESGAVFTVYLPVE